MYQVRVRVGDNVCRDIHGDHLLSQLLQLHGGVFYRVGEVLQHTHTHERTYTHREREEKRLQT